jgi:hypothetical protein
MRYEQVQSDKKLSRIRHSAAALCYALAWLSMVVLIGIVSVAELLQGDADFSPDSAATERLTHAAVPRRIHP